MMDASTPGGASGVRRAYWGEVYGEAMYTSIAEQQSDPNRRAAWRSMVDLETAMRERLASLFLRLGGDPKAPEAATWSERGRADGLEYAGMPWTEMIARFDRELDDVIERYRRLEHGWDGDDAAALALLTEHEVVAQDFARRHLDGRSATALDPVLDLIERLRGEA